MYTKVFLMELLTVTGAAKMEYMESSGNNGMLNVLTIWVLLSLPNQRRNETEVCNTECCFSCVIVLLNWLIKGSKDIGPLNSTLKIIFSLEH